jgi:predicted PurR-regulated permease PerM
MMTKGGELVKELPQKISVNLKETAKSYLSPEILAQLKILVRDWRDVYSSSSETLNDMAVEWLKNIFLQVGALSSWFLDFLLVPFYFFFIVISLNRTWDFVESTFIPYDYREQILRILSKVHFSLSSFFRGRLVICVIIGILAWLGFSFMGVPFAFLLGFSVGFATIVPLLGLLFLVPAMLCFGIIGASVEQQLVLLIFYGILQGLEMLVLGPFILGKEVELPPMILVMSVLICGYLFGGIGVVLAVPIASTVKILMAEFVYPSFVELSKKGSDYTGVERRRKGEKESVPKANSY